MDVFQRNYTTFYHMLRFAGLWPYDNSILPKIQRFVLSTMTLCCIAIQISTIRNVEKSLTNMLTLLSFGIPMWLFWLRYVSFIVVFPLVRTYVENVQNDYFTIQDPSEVETLKKYVNKTRQIVMVYLGLSIVAMCFIAIRVITPTLMRSQYQLYSLQFYGFFYSERCRQADWVSIHLSLTCAIGLLTVSCTESFLAFMAFYLCGQFEIVSCRLRDTINTAAKTNSVNLINIGPAVKVHQNIIKLAQSSEEAVLLPYLIAIVLVVFSVSVNLYRASTLMTEMNQMDEAFMSFLVIFTHVAIMFLNNYSGQQLANISANVFNETYNSLWYTIPPKSQKLLLLILMKTSTELKFNLAGLFSPCFEGFTMMMSSSFSYFTVLCSI